MEEFKKKVKNNRNYLIILIIFFITAIFFNNPFRNDNNEYTFKNLRNKKDDVIQLVDCSVSQKFIATDNNLRKVSFFVGTYQQESVDDINVKIIEVETNKIIFEDKVLLNELEDNSFLVVNIENQANSKGKEYEITISPSKDSTGKNIALFLKELDEKSDGNAYYTQDQKIIDGELILANTYLNKNIFIFNVLLWSLIFIVSAMYIIYFLDEKLDEHQFLKIALTLMLFFACFTTVFHPFDESNHFFKSYLISQGDLYSQRNDENVVGGYVSKTYNDVIQMSNPISLKTIFFEKQIYLNKMSKENTFFRNMYFCSIPPSGHFIPAVGILIAKILGFGFVGLVYLGRIMNYLFYIACAYFTIKNMKYYKSTTFIVALSPMLMWLAGSFSLDPVVSGASMLFISICLKYFFESEKSSEKVSNKDIILIFLCAFLCFTNKYLAYAPIVLMFFLIPIDKFKSKKQYAIIICSAIIIGLLCIFWQYKCLGMFSDCEEDRNGNVNQSEQMEFILSNKIATLRILLKEVEENIIIWAKNYSYLPALISIGKSYGIIMILGAIFEKNKFNMKSKTKSERIKFYFVNIMTFSIFILFSILALYLTYTEVGAKSVAGYQSRYILPVLMLYLIPISNIFNIENKINNYEKKVIFIMFIANLNMILGELVNSFIQ